MEGTRGWVILAGFLGLFLVQCACGAPVTPIIDRFDCETRGGTWHNQIKPGETHYSRRCETPTVHTIATPLPDDTPTSPGANPTPTATEEDLGRGDCIALKSAYTWSYEGFQSSSGTGGTTCNARFVFTNTGNESLLVVFYTSFDNNKMKDDVWGTYSLAPGASREERVSRTNYQDGVVTFSRVDSILVVWDLPECAGILKDGSQAVWKAQSFPVEEMACP